jgi:4-phytase/acid phosphatase
MKSTRRLHLCLATLTLLSGESFWSVAQTSPASSPKLQFVVIVTRHGVRSPTGKTDQLNAYSSKPWPAWSVPPGYLTEHGAKLMTQFGAYDRAFYAQQGLFSASPCEEADRLFIYADSDQRTRETGKALAAGLFPGCPVETHGLPEGTADPLFHTRGQPSDADKQLALAAVSGRIGGNPAGLTEAYRLQLDALQQVLRGCIQAPCAAPTASPAASFLDVPSTLAVGKSDHLAEMHGPLSLASTMSENLLLEYTEGFETAKVGWGNVDGAKLRELIQLHTAASDVMLRTPFIARAQATNLMEVIVNSMRQAAEQKPASGALGPAKDRMLIVVGHDTNLNNIAGALGLSWLIDGRRDDTPPGGALVFELWKSHAAGEFSVRTFYMAQTLDQMRNATTLNLKSSPERVPVFVPGCSRADGSCTWNDFKHAVGAATSSAFTQ